MSGEEPGNANLRVGDGWHSRGYMPHFDRTEVIQHVTFHLADSLPKNVLAELDAELRALPPEQQDAERRKRIETWMDAGYGSCLLGDTNVAAIVQDSLLHFDGQRYRILAWVIMPNHVHVLVQPMNGSTIAKIVASWKSFTAKRIMEDSGHANLRVGPMWHREYWDRFIRDERHLQTAVDYIHSNPVKAGLCAEPQDWAWSSASVRRYEANTEVGVPRKDPTRSMNSSRC